MVTVVFHWGANPQRGHDMLQMLGESLDWFKTQPGFLMGVFGHDAYNPSELVSCLEWENKEQADRAYAKWEQEWTKRLQPMLARPISFVTYNTVGMFAGKGVELPGRVQAGVTARGKRASGDKAMMAGARAEKGTSARRATPEKAATMEKRGVASRTATAGKRTTQATTGKREAKPAAEPKLGERAMGAESRARAPKR